MMQHGKDHSGAGGFSVPHHTRSPGVAPARSAPLSLLAKSLENLAPRAGLEPATQRLTEARRGDLPAPGGRVLSPLSWSSQQVAAINLGSACGAIADVVWQHQLCPLLTQSGRGSRLIWLKALVEEQRMAFRSWPMTISPNPGGLAERRSLRLGSLYSRPGCACV